MARSGLQYEDFVAAANQFVLENKQVPTHEAIRSVLDTSASMTTIAKFLKEWKNDCVLVSVKNKKELLKDPEQFGQQLHDMWVIINAENEEKITKDRTEKNQIIDELNNKLDSLISQSQQQDEQIEALHEKCQQYQLNELKLKVNIKSLEEEVNALSSKLHQTESFIPHLKEESQKFIQKIQEQSDINLNIVTQNNELFKVSLEEQKKMIQDHHLQELDRLSDKIKAFEINIVDLKEILGVEQNKGFDLKLKNEVLIAKNLELNKTIEKYNNIESLLKQIVDHDPKFSRLLNEILAKLGKIQGQDFMLVFKEMKKLSDLQNKLNLKISALELS